MRPLLVIIVIIIGLYLAKVFVLDANKNEAAQIATAASKSTAASSKLPVDIYVAKEIDKGNTIYASGTVIANEEVDIKSEVSGRLLHLHIVEGGPVSKGQLIAKINDKDLVTQLKKIEFEEELADQTASRYKKLLEINAISKEEYDMAVNKVNTLSADKEYIQVQVEKTSVRAPFSGRMGLKNISEGAYITPGVVIVNLVQTNPVKLDFSLPEKYANKVVTGQKIFFSIDGENDKWTADVIAIDPQIDEDLRTLRVRARTDNSKGQLLPGMFVRVEVPLGSEKSIMIPSEAIIPILKGKKVFVMRNGAAQETIIKTGLRTESEVQVEEGIQIGDSIIVSSLMSVKENTQVELRKLVE